MPDLFQNETIEISPEFRETLKRNYFLANKAQFPSFFAGSVIMAYLFTGLAIFFVLYFRAVFLTFFFAIIFIVVAFIYTFRWLKPFYDQKRLYQKRPTHTIIEKWLVEDILKIVKPHAIEMLSLNPATITPDNFIIVPHPVFWDISDIEPNNVARIQNDKYFNYSIHIIQVLALSNNYISYYSCTFDWINNNAIVSPFTLEFFYEDISSIRVENHENSHRLKDAPEKTEDETEDYSAGKSQVVVVKNKSGETIDVTVSIPKLLYTPRITLKTEKVMQTLRIMLRNKRFGEEYQIFKPDDLQK